MLVSCIMPVTSDRRALMRVAIDSYLAQTHAEKELIVVADDGPPLFDLVADIPGIVYLHYPGKMKVGRKRNIACEHAAGELIAHFDSDDWSAPDRLRDQLARLGTKAVTGYDSMLFWDGLKAYRYQGAVCGTSLCYRKDWWARNRFPDVAYGEDSAFVNRAGNALISTTGEQRMVARIHASNTSRQYETHCGTAVIPEVPSSDIPAAFFQVLNA